MTAFQEGIVQANGLAIQYYRSGAQHRQTLLLLHGITDGGLCWTPVEQALAARYDVLMTDARGHGKTRGPLDGFSGETLARDAAAVIRALGLESPRCGATPWGL
jgi:pimeloyl-ACP methyl ester carboxylesterase